MLVAKQGRPIEIASTTGVMVEHTWMMMTTMMVTTMTMRRICNKVIASLTLAVTSFIRWFIFLHLFLPLTLLPPPSSPSSTSSWWRRWRWWWWHWLSRFSIYLDWCDVCSSDPAIEGHQISLLRSSIGKDRTTNCRSWSSWSMEQKSRHQMIV